MTPTGEPIPLNFEFMQHSFHQRADLGSSQPQHVAQQIRRDKLRIQQHVSSSPPSSSTPSSRISDPILQAQEVEESRNSELSRSGYSGLPGIGGLIPLRYDPNSMISAEMMSSSSAGRLPSFKDSVPESNNGWKSLNYQASTDRIVNCMQNPSAQSPAMGSTVLGSVGGFPIYNLSGQPSPAVMNPNCGGREDVQRDQVHQSQFLSPAPQEIKVREQSHGLLLPSFGNMPSVQWGFNEWNHKQGGLKPQWVEDSFIGREAINGWFRTDATGQGLSLSLSFRNPTPESQLQHETRFGTENFAACPASACTIGHHEKRKQEPVGDCFSFHKDGPAAFISRIEKSPVPLGPFTGYATVLKSSKFLKPAQQLLDELCNVGKVAISTSSTSDDDGNIGKFQTNNDQIEMDGQYGDSGVSCGIPSDKLVNPPPCISSSVYLSSNAPAEQDRRNEHRSKKNRLISMLDEVYRKYRHFCGQLQAVLASFETVAGLSNAAPYTSMAVKAMSRYFHHLKNAINSQLKFTGKVLGEDCFLSGTVRGDEISKLGLEAGRLRQRDAGCLRISEPQQQQQVWRPQRGLPERAVAVLRAWLFEHFLHPYPTDTDKQTLAKQTGLTRSQVSNWFINARVRLWKPMVEEIHMMESRNSSSSEFNSVSRPESVAIIGESRRSQAAPLPDGRQNCDISDHPHGHLLPTKQWQTNVSQIPIIHDRGIGASSTLYQQNEASVKATPATGGIGGVYLSLGP